MRRRQIYDSRGTTSSGISSSAAIAAACTGPGAAGHDEREIARIEAAAHADLAHAGRHRDVDDVVDARRGLLEREPERLSDVLLDRSRRSRAVERHPAAEEAPVGQEPEHEIGVGHRRLRAAAPVAGGAGVGARRSAGPTCSMPPASTRAIEPPPAPIVWMSIIGRAIRQRSTTPSVITSGSPFVTSAASKLVPPMSIVMQSATPVRRELPEPGRRTRRRPREQRERGALGDLGGRRHTAVRLHDQQHAAESEVGEAGRECRQIARDDRPDVGVQHGRGRAVVVAHLGQQVARRGHVRAGQQLAAEIAGGALVRSVGRRVHERDRDGLHALAAEDLAGGADVVERERRDLLAGPVDAPLDAEAQVAGDERDGRLQAVVVRLLAQADPQRERVAEALRGQQAGACAAAGEHGVRRDRRAVHDRVDGGDERRDVRAEPRGDLREPGGEADRRVAGRRARLVDDPAAVLGDHEEVGERPAHVDPDPVAHARSPRRRAVSASSIPERSASTATP